jgi:hypothetical protein
MRLDRDANVGNSAWDRLARGDVIAVTPPPELERARITAASVVAVAGPSDPRASPSAAAPVASVASVEQASTSLENGLLAVSECVDAESR